MPWKFDKDIELKNVKKVNIFGLWRYLIRFSPLNCSKGFCILPFFLSSLVVGLAMGLRIYWMFWQTRTSFLTYGWGEANVYAFLTLESLALLIGIVRITWRGSIRKFEVNIGALRTLRINKFYSEYDNCKLLHCLILIWLVIIGVSIIGSSLYLLLNEQVIFGTFTQSSWYYILNFIISMFCFYVHILYIPFHTLLNSAIQREIDVFNLELTEQLTLEDSKLETLRQFGKRQVTLQNFVNYMTSKQSLLLNYAGFTIMMVVLNGSYITTTLRDKTNWLYYICSFALNVSSILITYILLKPHALIQESLVKTSKILLSAASLQDEEVCPTVIENCRMMINRSLHNRTTATVLFIFNVSRKNIEVALFVITQIIIIMSVIYRFTEFADETAHTFSLLLLLLFRKMINFTDNVVSVYASKEDCLVPAPEYYENMMHFLHFLTLPNYILSIYVLIYEAPKPLRQYRNYLLWHTIGNIIFEIYISIFFLPVTYLPLVVFRGAGILKYLNTQGLLQFYLMVFCVVHTGTSILEMFRYRFDAAIAEETLSRKILQKILIFFWIFALSIPVFCIITMPTCVPKQDNFKQNLMRAYPNSSIQIMCDTTVVAPPLIDPIFTPLLSLIVIALLFAAIIIPHTTATIWMRLDYLSKHLSPKTVQLQKMLLLSLFIQAAIHGTLLGIPIFGFLYAVLFSLENDDIAYFLLLLISFHGSVSTVAMVFFTKPIRNGYIRVVRMTLKMKPPQENVTMIFNPEATSTSMSSRKSTLVVMHSPIVVI